MLVAPDRRGSEGHHVTRTHLPIERLREIVGQAVERGDEHVELDIELAHPPKRGKPIRPRFSDGDTWGHGPRSCSDASIVGVGDSTWRTRWWTADLARWLRDRDAQARQTARRKAG